ncbi:oxygen-dependent coproporphyrinogen-III oxidase, mitochondrial-like [Arapaima gigas]
MTNECAVVSFLEDCARHRFGARAGERAARFLRTCARLQRDVCEQLRDIDGTEVTVDFWRREGGGGGATAVLRGGAVFLQANVDVTMVTGRVQPSALGQLREAGRIQDTWPEGDCEFLAVAISSIFHVKNPHVPSYHFNLRLLLLNLPDGTEVGWFGGVIDITPFYLIPEDITHFHRTLKEACEKHDAAHYPRFKKWCDDYFLIRHRGETRGLGGIFFDNLTFEEDGNFEFARSCADAILPAYFPILRARVSMPFTDRENTWKLLRYGRYIEFNLMYDNGTKFGLQLPGFRMETLFASLPIMARWGYNLDLEPGSREEELVSVLRCPRDWV